MKKPDKGPHPMISHNTDQTLVDCKRTSLTTKDDDEDYVEIVLDLSDNENSVGISTSAATTTCESESGPANKLGLENKFSSSITSSTLVKTFKRLDSIKPSRGVRRFDRTKSAASQALLGLKFISQNEGGDSGWTEVEIRFNELTRETNSGLLHRSNFGECIGMNQSKEFAEELFDALSRRRNISGDSIDKERMKQFWDQIADQGFDSRLRTFFDMVDKNADGRITEEEVREIISLSASANKLSNIHKQADEHARLIMEELDPNNEGYIMIESLETILLQGIYIGSRGRDLSQNRQLSKMISDKLKPRQGDPLRRCFRELHYFLMDNWRRVWVVTLWIIVMLSLFAYKYLQYKHRAVFHVMGNCVCVAKGAAETLKLNMALILLPVCRNTITWLRNKTKLGLVVPFDDNLNFHKVIAGAIAIGVALHAISHLTCDFPRLIRARPEEYEAMKQYFGKQQPKSYGHFLKSWEGVTGILMVLLMAIAFTLASPWFRRKRVSLPKPLNKLAGFNAFWYTHHSFVFVYALLIVHGMKLYLTREWYKKTTWMYLAIPASLYTCERLIRSFRSKTEAVKILKVAVYPGNVLNLHMSKPHGFKYKSGQYIFVNCGVVSPFEWHPFSITSAPKDDYISVHIRTLGDWTRQLRTLFSEVCQPPTGKSGLLRADYLQGENNLNFPKVLVDGPYGAPTQDYKNYDVVLLIGLGIGATPMISVVKDIIHNIKSMEDQENSRTSSMEGGTVVNNIKKQESNNVKRHANFKTTRAYFYWVTREQGSFEWFKGVMNEVGEMDRGGVIEMHSYCTSVYEEGDARSALIAMIQSLNHAKHGVDIVSGTRVMSHFAKPNWRTVYKRIALNHPDTRVGVFYCGAPPPVKELRQLASDFSRRTSTKFEFHKENF